VGIHLCAVTVLLRCNRRHHGAVPITARPALEVLLNIDFELGDGDDEGCPLCVDEPEPDAPVHGSCLLRQALGGVGHLVDPQRWAEDPDAGLSPRLSAVAVEAMVRKWGADELVAGEVPIDERRRQLAIVQAVVAKDWVALAKLAPQHVGLLMAFGKLTPADITPAD
jgi:hypothetical protein